MAKKDSDKAASDPQIESFAARITTARREAKRWKEYETAQVDEFKAYVDGKTDVLYLTGAGDEVISVTETTPSVTYDYKAFFADHPELNEVLRENYAKEGRSQVRVTTNWVERN